MLQTCSDIALRLIIKFGLSGVLRDAAEMSTGQ